MSADPDRARSIADRIARRVLSGAQQQAPLGGDLSGELAAFRAGLSDLQRRLANIEAKVRSEVGEPNAANERIPLTHSPWLAGVNAGFAHPSQERFGIEEATVSELVDFFEKEKTCSIEPGEKPCDHCSMCSTRGF